MKHVVLHFSRRREVAEGQKGAIMGAAIPTGREAGEQEQSWKYNRA